MPTVLCYVLWLTSVSGFESHSLRHIFNGLESSTCRFTFHLGLTPPLLNWLGSFRWSPRPVHVHRRPDVSVPHQLLLIGDKGANRI
jgi:hypothetical protein